MTNVQVGVKNAIIGKKVNPTTKLAPQLVLVLMPDPRDRTLRGNNSLCIHGTLPNPIAYAPTYNITLASTSIEAVREERGISSCATTEEGGFAALRSEGRSMKMNPILQSRRPVAIIGIEESRIRLRPIRSIRNRAAQVMMKFVIATVSDVSVGLAKPNSVNMVAEKYISEF